MITRSSAWIPWGMATPAWLPNTAANAWMSWASVSTTERGFISGTGGEVTISGGGWPAPMISRHSGKSLDVEGISVANGARLIQWEYWGGGNQRFRLDPVGDGYYRIMIEHSGKCLDVEGISLENGVQVIQWEYWGGDNQKFKPEPTGDGYYKLVAKHSGKCLDVSGISADNGAGIIQWDWWGGNNQQWRL